MQAFFEKLNVLGIAFGSPALNPETFYESSWDELYAELNHLSAETDGISM